MSNKIVITGASGYLATSLLHRLSASTHFAIYALSSKCNSLREIDSDNRIVYSQRDAYDFDYNLLKDAIIVNCAFPRNSTGRGLASGMRYIQHLFNRAVDQGAEAIVNISSQSVYSQRRDQIATEETPICPESNYAVAKYATELMLESVCRDTNTRHTNLRIASLIGPGFNQRIVNRFVWQALNGKTLSVVINGQRFGYLDIEDASNAIVSLLGAKNTEWKPIYTVGNGTDYSIEEIANKLNAVFNECGYTFPGITRRYDKSIGTTAVDYHLLNLDTGYTPVVSLEQSIQRILADFTIS